MKAIALWVPGHADDYIELGRIYNVECVRVNDYLGTIKIGPNDDDLATIVIDGKRCAHLDAPWLLLD